jgi:hypothetical protein
MKRYLLNQLVAADIAVNALLGGSPYETISERCYRHREHWAGALTVGFIDWLFRLFGQQDHCKNSDEGNEADYEVWG